MLYHFPEDSVKGIQAAQRAHMHTVGIGSPKDIGLIQMFNTF